MVASMVADFAATSAALSDFTSREKVVIFGSARVSADSPLYAATHRLSAGFSGLGFVVITGGGPGVMAAGLEGAGAGNALGIAIQLPFESPALVHDVPVVMQQRFFTRKLALVRKTRAVVVLPGGFGTLDETFEVLTLLQTGKKSPCPVVLFDPTSSGFFDPFETMVGAASEHGFVSPEDVSLFRRLDSTDDVLEHVRSFWSNFKKFSFADDGATVSLRTPFDPSHLDALGESFPAFAPFSLDSSRHNLRFRFDRRNFGLLRRLIDVLNSTP